MSFLARLFNKKKVNLKRSNTDPQSSSESETDKFDPSAYPAARAVARRPGCELTRAHTTAEVTCSNRSSVSSSTGTDVLEDSVRSKYRNMRPVHRGRGCTILSATERASRQPVYLKAYAKSAMDNPQVKQRLENETQQLREMAGFRGVVRLLNMLEDDEFSYIVLEQCPGVTLIELIANNKGRLPEAYCAAEVAIPLMQTLAGLHAQGCVHRNLKPEHVICAPGCNVKLVDFTEAGNKRHRCLNNRSGALEYSAPEVLDKPSSAEVFHKVLLNGMAEEDLPQYDEKVDVFSFGVLVYEALTGLQPFQGENAAEVLAVQQERLSDLGPSGLPNFLASNADISQLAQTFLASALQLSPKARPSADELLQHAWVQQHMQQYQVRRAQARVRRSFSDDAARMGQVMYTSGAAAVPTARKQASVKG